MRGFRASAASTNGASSSALRLARASSRSWNSGITLRREELEGRADVIVAVPAGLLDEDHLVDARLLERLRGARGAGPACRCPRRPMSGIIAPICWKLCQMSVRPGLWVPKM